MADIKLIDAQGDERTYSGVAKVKIPLADGTGNATFIQPAGKKELTGTNEVDVTNFATAQVVDKNLIAENIKSGVSILGVKGTHEGGGECSGEHIIKVDTLPEVGEEGAIYEQTQAFSDVVVYMKDYNVKLVLSENNELHCYVLPTTPDDITTLEPTDMSVDDAPIHAYFIEDANDIFMYTDMGEGLTLTSFEALGFGTFIGTISDVSEATSDGYYAIGGGATYYQYINNEWVRYAIVINESLAFTSNGDGTCYVSGIGTCTDKDIVVPSVSPDGDTVTGIGEEAFGNIVGGALFNSITIPDTVTSIGKQAFYKCQGLKSVTLGNGVQSIGQSAFSNCTSLVEITLPDSLTTIGESAFYGCSALESVTIPNGVDSIPTHGFEKCYALNRVGFGSGIKTIGHYAFQYCLSLRTITLPETVVAVQSYAFSQCRTLSSIYFNGTKVQWASIQFGAVWNGNVLVSYVPCSDGNAKIEDKIKTITENGEHGVGAFATAIVNVSGIVEVDKLPTENIREDVLYLCGGRYCKYCSASVGTWLLNDEIALDSLTKGVLYPLKMYSNNARFHYLSLEGTAPFALAYMVKKGQGVSPLIVYNNGWSDEAYRTIEVIEEPTETVTTWLNTNGKKLTGTGWVEYKADNDSIIGTWVFNDTITAYSDYPLPFDVVYNGITYTECYCSLVGGVQFRLSASNTPDITVYENGWLSEGYKTLTITNIRGDSANEWLKANATKQ